MGRPALAATLVLAALTSVTAHAEAPPLYVVSVDYTAAAADFEHLKSLVATVARASIGEPGCRRFDVVVPAAKPNHLLLFEVFDDAAASQAHVASAHFKAFVAGSGTINATRVATPGSLLLSLHNP